MTRISNQTFQLSLETIQDEPIFSSFVSSNLIRFQSGEEDVITFVKDRNLSIK